MSRVNISQTIALLGASSQIAKDLIKSLSSRSDLQLLLYVRDISALNSWISTIRMQMTRISVHSYSEYGRLPHDVVINFVGVGDPKQAAQMGAAIFELTQKYDNLVLEQLVENPTRRYIFLSSGAVYGGSFSAPVDENTPSVLPINNIQQADWYGAAKMFAECRHRSFHELAIVDIRIFNYISRSQDMSARYLITDIVRAIRDNTVLQTSSDYIVRDFLHPLDFYRLIRALLNSPVANASIDCFSRAPIDKPSLLDAMQQEFGLRYEILDAFKGINATGNKTNYYSKNFRASEFGYEPSLTSLEGILMETTSILGRGNPPLKKGRITQ